MDKTTLAWLIFGGYLIVTVALALRGMAKTKDLAGFALGNRDMGPLLVGITLAAATASSATFIINPGFVYQAGLSAFLHFAVAGMGGVIVGLVVLSKGFRRLGNQTRALTLPHWLGARYDSPAMRTYIAVFNLLMAVAFVVLIVKGSALVMAATLGLGYKTAVIVVVLVVFSYIMLGGTYAHAYTNALQGFMMILIALALFASGLHLFGDGVGAFFDKLALQDPNLVKPLNPDNALFSSAWEVFACGFVISIGLVCQPHILTKSLYLEDDREVNIYLLIAAGVMICYSLVLATGLFARVAYPDLSVQDAVMPHYISQAFSPTLGILISVALLAAGMSTMDGILVSASSIAGNDVVLALLGDRLWRDKSDEEKQKLALAASRWVLVGMGVIAFLISIDPPDLVGIFAQVMVYGIVAAVLPPMVVGIYVKDVDRRDALLASVVGPLVHFGHYSYRRFIADEALVQPAGPATEGTLIAFALLIGLTLWRRSRRSAQLPPSAVLEK